MALPHLIKYVYTNGTDEVIRRGKKIHAIGFVELIEYDELMGSVTFRVKDDSYSTYYKVYVQHFKDPKAMSVRCSCPYNLGDICRHEAGALIQLQELLDRNLLKAEVVAYDQRHTVVKMKTIDLKTIRLLCSQQTLADAEKFLATNKAVIDYAKDEMVKASVDLDGTVYKVVIKKNEERNLDTSCDYEDTLHPLCLPKVIVLLQLYTKHGAHYFDTIRNWDNEKNKLLEAYGYTLSDDLKGKFEFAYKEGKPFLRVLDTSIKRINPLAVSKPRPVLVEEPVDMVADEERKTTGPAQRLGIVFNFNHKTYPFFLVEVVQGESDGDQKKFVSKVEKIDLSKFVNIDILNEEDKLLVPSIRRMQEAEVTRYLNRNSPFSGIWENIIHQDTDELPEETRNLMIEYLHPKLRKLFTDIAVNPFVFYLNGHKPFKTDNLKLAGIVPEPIVPFFKIAPKKSNYEVTCWVKLNGKELSLQENQLGSNLMFFYEENLYLWKDAEDVEKTNPFTAKGSMVISKADWPKQIRNYILPLAKKYHVEFDPALVSSYKDGEPEKKLLLQEKSDYLVFQPVFTYKGFEVRTGDKDEIIVPDGEKVLIVHRNKESEQDFIAKLEALHSNFIKPEGSYNLVLKGADVLRNNWFFLFVDAMKEQKVPVYGFEALKNFRFQYRQTADENLYQQPYRLVRCKS